MKTCLQISAFFPNRNLDKILEKHIYLYKFLTFWSLCNCFYLFNSPPHILCNKTSKKRSIYAFRPCSKIFHLCDGGKKSGRAQWNLRSSEGYCSSTRGSQHNLDLNSHLKQRWDARRRLYKTSEYNKNGRIWMCANCWTYNLIMYFTYFHKTIYTDKQYWTFSHTTPPCIIDNLNYIKVFWETTCGSAV